MRLGGDHTDDLVNRRVREHASPWCHNRGATPSRALAAVRHLRVVARTGPIAGARPEGYDAKCTALASAVRGELKSRSHYASGAK
jgi:hypothetical protein